MQTSVFIVCLYMFVQDSVCVRLEELVTVANVCVYVHVCGTLYVCV